VAPAWRAWAARGTAADRSRAHAVPPPSPHLLSSSSAPLPQPTAGADPAEVAPERRTGRARPGASRHAGSVGARQAGSATAMHLLSVSCAPSFYSLARRKSTSRPRGVGRWARWRLPRCRLPHWPPSLPSPLSFTNLSILVIIFTFPFQIRQVYWGELVTDMAEGLAHGPDTSTACSTSSTTPLISPAPPPSHAPGANSVRSLLIPICFLTRLPPIRGLVAELHA
jgi:hypothetical protein